MNYGISTFFTLICTDVGVTKLLSVAQQLSNSPDQWFAIWAQGLCIMFSYISLLILRSCVDF